MDATGFRIATFNLENLDVAAGGGLERRVAQLRPQLLRLHADVLCLQEVNAQHRPSTSQDVTAKQEGNPPPERTLAALDTLLAGTPYAQYHRVHTFNPSASAAMDRHNLVILSRTPFTHSAQIHHHYIDPPLYRLSCATPPAPEDPQPVRWDRPFQHGVIEPFAGMRLHIINVHLRAPRAAFVPGCKDDAQTWNTLGGWSEGFFLAAVKRAGQALEVRLFLESLFDEDPQALILVTGDFNADTHEIPLRMIRGDDEDCANGALRARILTPLENALAQSQRFSVIHGGRRQMVDHMLASQTLMAWFSRIEIHNEDLNDEFATPAVVPDTPQSFHAPVVVELTPPQEVF